MSRVFLLSVYLVVEKNNLCSFQRRDPHTEHQHRLVAISTKCGVSLLWLVSRWVRCA